MDWWRVSEKEMLGIAPKMLTFMLLAPFLLWGVIRLFSWMFAT
jgi:hypothetical protein